MTGWQYNVSEWNDMSICRRCIQCTSTTEINGSVLFRIIKSKFISPWYRWHVSHRALRNNHPLYNLHMYRAWCSLDIITFDIMDLPDHHGSPTGFSGVLKTQSLYSCRVFCRQQRISFFVMFLLTIPLSDLHRFVSPGNPLASSNLFLTDP